MISIDILDYLSQKGVRLTPQQQQGLSLSEEPLLLLAVPGSGKTTVLVSRVAAQLLSGIPPSRLLNLTFSRESAKDMAARFAALFPELPPPRFSTIHSLCYSVLRAYAGAAGRVVPAVTGSGDAPSSGQLLRKAAAALSLGYLEEEDVEELLSKIGLIKNRMLPLSEAGSLEEGYPLPALYTRYQAEKSALGLMDYDDILLYARTFLEKLPALREKFRRRYTHLNVDESQDISPVQLAVLRLLSPEGKGLFMVGDEDQSIYGFRGASPDGILRFTEYFPTGQVVRMEQNFRSRPEILAHCGRFIALCPERYDKSLLPARDPRPGAVAAVHPGRPLDAMGKVLEKVAALGDGETLGILYRTGLSAFLTADLLLRAGVEFSAAPSSRRLDRYQARDILAVFRAAAGPDNRTLLRQLPALDFDGGGAERARLAESWDGVTPIGRYLSAQKGPRTARLGETVCAVKGEKPLNALFAIGRRLRCGKVFFAACLSGDDPAGALRAAVLKELCGREGSIPALLSRVELLERTLTSPPDLPGAKVRLSTIHAAKGLEYDHVLLLDCADGILPARPRGGAGSEEKNRLYYEEMRLFYVAATRARETLTLFFPARSDKGLIPSRFLESFLEEAGRKPSPGFWGRVLHKAAPKSPFAPGDAVVHPTLGAGKVLSVKADTVTVLFPKGEVTLSLSYCLEQKLLAKG